MFYPLHSTFLLLVLLSLPLSASAGLSTGANPGTDLRFWQWEEAGIVFKITQRLPDQTRAFFAARGFDRQNRERIALACVFQSEFRNTADKSRPPVEYDLSTWRVHTPKQTQKLLVRETWQEIWQQQNVPEPAKIAFEWSLLPTYQVLQAHDYNWGMTAYGLSPGSHFDLEFSWSRGDKQYTRRIENIQCPPDIHPQPE